MDEVSMRVAHVCPFVGEQMGGSERYVFNLSKAQSHKHDVHIYTTTKYANKVGTSITNGVNIHRIYSPIVIWNVNPMVFALRYFAKSMPDILHIHSHLYIFITFQLN